MAKEIEREDEKLIIRLAGNKTFLKARRHYEIGKIELVYVNYKEKPAKTYNHYLDVNDFRVLANDIVLGKLDQPYVEYKGSVGQEGKPVARKLTVEYNNQLKIPYVVIFEQGLGEMKDTGAVVMRQKEVTEKFFASVHDIKKMMLAVLNDILVWEIKNSK